MIPMTPELQARLAAKKVEWRESQNKAKTKPAILVCTKCRRPGLWTERVIEKRERMVLENGLRYLKTVAVPVVYVKSSPLRYQTETIEIKNGLNSVHSLMHDSCGKPRVRESVLWGGEGEVSFWQRLTAKKPKTYEAQR